MNRLKVFPLSRLENRVPTVASSPNCRLWQAVSTPPPPMVFGRLMATAAISENDVWTVGYTWSPNIRDKPPSPTLTLIEHWNGVGWEIIKSPNPQPTGNNVLYGVSALDLNNVWAVGFSSPMPDNFETGQPFIIHWNG